ncbi:hypothetical protein RIR_jg15612.t1 [Rhizophagus irregularis DAOM 181602=DAOM 197198]|nr:hypothetical protein RIR_jg15612.t1 [Rhizophagus irregularis DAOM 181602=DAOM 197198]
MNPSNQELNFFPPVEAPESFHLFPDNGGDFLDADLIVVENEGAVDVVGLVIDEEPDSIALFLLGVAHPGAVNGHLVGPIGRVEIVHRGHEVIRDGRVEIVHRAHEVIRDP